MTGIYRNLEIIGNGNTSSPDRFPLLMEKLNRDFSLISMFSPASPNDAGITQIYPNFPRERFREELYRITIKKNIDYKVIDILQTFAPNLNDFKHELIRCLNHKVLVRIVLSWPFSLIAQFRENALNRYSLKYNDEYINFEHEVKSNLETLRYILNNLDSKKSQNLLKIRLYDTIPSVALYRVGNYMLSSYFFHGQLAIDNFQFEMNLDAINPLVVNRYQRDFELMLEMSRDFSSLLLNDNWYNDLRILF